MSYRNVGNCYVEGKLKVGSKIKFKEEKQKYIVQASNVAFAVCNKPFNCRKTTLYTIIDWMNNIRGPENLIFGMGAETREKCEEMLERLTQGESEVSYWSKIKLNIDRYEEIKTKEKTHGQKPS